MVIAVYIIDEDVLGVIYFKKSFAIEEFFGVSPVNYFGSASSISCLRMFATTYGGSRQQYATGAG